MSNHAASTRPPKCLSLESKAHRKARLFHTSGTWVPPQYSPSHAVRSFTIRDRAKCPRRRARSFDEGIIVSRPSAVGRDVIADLYALSKFESLLFYADSCNAKIRHQITTGASDLPMRPFLILAIFGFRRMAAFDVEIFIFHAPTKAKNSTEVHE